MAIVEIPYGSKTLSVQFEERNLLGVIEPSKIVSTQSVTELVRVALDSPIGSGTLTTILKKCRPGKILIVISDITRASPDDIVVPALLSNIAAADVSFDAVTIIVAVGMHRSCTNEELRIRLGNEIMDHIRVINSDPLDAAKLSFLGTSRSGCPMWVSSEVMNSDFVISTGIIEPHLYAGYSGGRKSIAIGVAGEETIAFQHQPTIFDNPYTRICQVKGNLFHENATEIARRAGLRFIVNSILNSAGEVVGVVAGDPEEAFDAGVKFADTIYNVPISQQADMVIAGVKSPKDSNLFQATRGASYIAFSPYPSVKRGGLIIIPAETPEGAGDGLGERRYHEMTKREGNPDAIIKSIRDHGVQAGEHRAYMMALTIKHANVAIVGSRTPDIVSDLLMVNYTTIEEALLAGFKHYGKDATVAVIPNSLQVVTSLNNGGKVR